MRKDQISKVMIYDQGYAGGEHPFFRQALTHMKQLMKDTDVEFIRLYIPEENHIKAAEAAEKAIREESPDIFLIGATSIGEEIAPSLGVKFGTGAAAHCTDIRINDNDRIAYMVPAFGGRVIGEIFISDSKPAIATVKPGVFVSDNSISVDFRTVDMSGYASMYDNCIEIIETEPSLNVSTSIEKAELIFCGGFGIGSEENWRKLELLAEKTGGAAACTRPVVDMGWGPDEYSMIGTSGKTVRPKVYIGFGISGASHHLCGIKDADIIININNDKTAEVFAASDYKAVLDAVKVLDSLMEKFHVEETV